jgi:hypothetical protein
MPVAFPHRRLESSQSSTKFSKFRILSQHPRPWTRICRLLNLADSTGSTGTGCVGHHTLRLAWPGGRPAPASQRWDGVGTGLHKGVNEGITITLRGPPLRSDPAGPQVGQEGRGEGAQGQRHRGRRCNALAGRARRLGLGAPLRRFLSFPLWQRREATTKKPLDRSRCMLPPPRSLIHLPPHRLLPEVCALLTRSEV